MAVPAQSCRTLLQLPLLRNLQAAQNPMLPSWVRQPCWAHACIQRRPFAQRVAGLPEAPACHACVCTWC